MTFQQCQAILSQIRLRQGTEHPILQVRLPGGVVRGRLSRADTDLVKNRNPLSPFGVLELEQLGLGRGAATLVQIANIPEDGLGDTIGL
jgi:hypothetical protein